MIVEQPTRRRPGKLAIKAKRLFHRLVEDHSVRKKDFREYQQKVQRVYDGPQGAMLLTASKLSGHLPLVTRWFRERVFDLHGLKRILDIGSGAGQIAQNLDQFADPDATITCIDLSLQMLRRARRRMDSARAWHVAADLTQLPFADGAFDCITCGYVLEYVPEPEIGLSEIARVLAPGGRMLLLATEDSFSGAWTSRLWRCRTLNRNHLRRICHDLGLAWKQELWFTRMHQVFRAGGVCVEIERR